ncbi:hypothetical protein Salat_2130600 [Sesamum alatum]|uniref:Uncharacterized protein n=1 Tax=Sesamum alatum TaxID=300844 RepID=A0AAE1Y165_9LAMI|nr:hypothetical protein Salat_2130600 [Sesamum alatum]
MSNTGQRSSNTRRWLFDVQEKGRAPSSSLRHPDLCTARRRPHALLLIWAAARRKQLFVAHEKGHTPFSFSSSSRSMGSQKGERPSLSLGHSNVAPFSFFRRRPSSPSRCDGNDTVICIYIYIYITFM